MVTRNDRLAQFIVDRDAPDGLAVEALCQDHVGTYVLPFPCRRADAATAPVSHHHHILHAELQHREFDRR